MTSAGVGAGADIASDVGWRPVSESRSTVTAMTASAAITATVGFQPDVQLPPGSSARGPDRRSSPADRSAPAPCIASWRAESTASARPIA